MSASDAHDADVLVAAVRCDQFGNERVAQPWGVGVGGSNRAWGLRWRAFPRLLLVVLVGAAAAGVRSAVADLRPAAEMLTVPA